MSNGRDNGCGCVVYGIFGVVFATAYVFAHLHAFKVGVGAAIGVFSCVVLVREGLRRLPARRPEAAAPAGELPTLLADIQPGLVSTAGLVGFSEHARGAPLGAPACVFFRVLVTHRDDPEKLIFEGRSADAITLEDGAGAKLVVQLDGATWRMTRCQEHDSTLLDATDDVARYLADRGIAASGPVRARVEWIAPHELVFVRGFARRVGGSDEAASDYRTTHESHFEVAATPEHPLTISIEPLPK